MWIRYCFGIKDATPLAWVPAFSSVNKTDKGKGKSTCDGLCLEERYTGKEGSNIYLQIQEKSQNPMKHGTEVETEAWKSHVTECFNHVISMRIKALLGKIFLAWTHKPSWVWYNIHKERDTVLLTSMSCLVHNRHSIKKIIVSTRR